MNPSSLPRHVRSNPLECRGVLLLALPVLAAVLLPVFGQQRVLLPERVSIAPPPIATDETIRYDYDIVYVRAPRRTDGREAAWAEFSKPVHMELAADLMLLRPRRGPAAVSNAGWGRR